MTNERPPDPAEEAARAARQAAEEATHPAARLFLRRHANRLARVAAARRAAAAGRRLGVLAPVFELLPI